MERKRFGAEMASARIQGVWKDRTIQYNPVPLVDLQAALEQFATIAGELKE